MTSSTQQFCGNCKSPVDPTEIVCPHCGVLLAAYASISGASAPESPAKDVPGTSPASPSPTASSPAPAPIPTPAVTTQPPVEVAAPPPTPALSPAMSPPLHRPSSQSPIGDALKQSHRQSQRDLGQLGDEPDALTRMVDEASDLTDMADGEDELSEMASGHDELARMAAGGDATLAEQVEAELTGATVRFDGAAPVIEASEDAIDTQQDNPVIAEAGGGSLPLEAEPAVVEDAAAKVLERPTDPRSGVRRSEPPAPVQPVKPAARPQESSGQRDGREQTIAWVNSDANARPRSRQSFPTDEPPIATLKPRDVVLWIPFGIMICVVLGIGGRTDGFIGFLLFALVVVTFGFLLKTTRATSRKTTTMPKQKPNSNRRR